MTLDYNDFNSEYSRFSQSLIEAVDEYNGLVADLQTYKHNGEAVPEDLRKETYRHMVIVEAMRGVCSNKYEKDLKVVYNDGWKFWIAEDKALREERYGRN